MKAVSNRTSLCIRAAAGMVSVLWVLAAAFDSLLAGDWPTYLLNNQRNAVTDERLPPPLRLEWVHHARHLPQPAWDPPAK